MKPRALGKLGLHGRNGHCHPGLGSHLSVGPRWPRSDVWITQRRGGTRRGSFVERTDTAFPCLGWSLVPSITRVGLESFVSSLECQGTSEGRIRSPRTLETHFFLSLEFLSHFPGVQIGNFISECVHVRQFARPFGLVYTLPQNGWPSRFTDSGLVWSGRGGGRVCACPGLSQGAAGAWPRGRASPCPHPQAVPLGSGLGTAFLLSRFVHVMTPFTYQDPGDRRLGGLAVANPWGCRGKHPHAA